MAAVAGPLDRTCSTAVSVDIDPGWYEGQLETADAAEQAAVLSPAAPAATQAASPEATPQQSSPTAAPAAAAAVPAGSHVPTVLTKLQKWGDYESFGEPVWPTKIIPMKTPLSHEILDNWQLPEAPRHRLTVSTLLEAQRAAGRRVGLLLDLSNHDCLYDIDIPSDVSYLHVQLVAKELPPLEFVREVARAANNFWAQQPDMYIAVHCAYGFNRTGFVVCSYLIEHCGLTVDQALQSFATARPPGVKHEKFRNELRARYCSSDSSGGGGGQALPVPVHSPLLQPSSSAGNSRLSAAAVAAVGSVGSGSVGAAGSRTVSCRSCGSTSSATAAGWPAGDSPRVGAGSPCGAELMLLAGSSPPVPSPAPSAAAAAAAADARVALVGPVAAASTPAADFDCHSASADAPRCCCCNAELAPDDTAASKADAGCCANEAATAAVAVQSGRASRASLPRRSLPDFASSDADDANSSSNTSCFARSSSTGAFCLTPPPPLPPMLTPSGSRAMLSSSPALRLPGRCWSSNSVGDNSSIGCSPTSSAADFVTLRTSCFNSTQSSGRDSSARGAADTPNNFYSAAAVAAAECGGSSPCRADVLLSAQWLAGSALERSLSQREAGSGSGEGLPYGSGILRGFSGGGCSSSGAEGAVDEDAAAGSGGEEGCFDMDPYTDPQQQSRGFSGQPPTGRQKSVKFQDAACCEQAAPGCGDGQQLPAAELDSLLAAVNITHQQQQQQLPGLEQHQQQQVQRQQSGIQRQVQLERSAAADPCSCSCHSQQQSAAIGYSIRDGEVGLSSSNSPQVDGRQRLLGDAPGVQGLRGRAQYSSEDGVGDPLENESFGRVTSADLLKHIRNLKNAHEPS